MALVQRLLVALAAVVLVFTALKWVVLLRRFNAAVAAARAQAEEGETKNDHINRHNIDDLTQKD